MQFVKPAVTDYLKIEAALQTRLLKAWRPIANSLYKRMVPLLADGEYDKALLIARSIDLGPVAKKNREYIKALLWKAAEFGAKQAAQSHKTAVSVGSYATMLNKVADLFIASFVLNATNQVHASALQSIADIENARKLAQKADNKQARFVKDFVSFRDEGDDMVKLVSSLHTSRLAVWGFTAEAEVRGVTKYRLSAVLDHRTSAFCRWINGKEFEVQGARERIVKTLQATSPDDLKTLAPWPNQSKASMAEIEGLTTKQLEARGFNVPPFHPNCRTICVLVGSHTEVISQKITSLQEEQEQQEQGKRKHPSENTEIGEETPVEQKEKEIEELESDTTIEELENGFYKPTADEFNEIGIDVTDPQLQLWNSLFDASPVDVMSLLSLSDPLAILGSKTIPVKFTSSGDVSLRSSTDLGDGKAGMNIVFDPYRQQVFLNYAEFDNADPIDAAVYMKNLYQRTAELARNNGTKQFVVNVSGGMGAYAHAMMGFVPTVVEWELLVDEIRKESDGLPLTDQQRMAVNSILESHDPKAIWAVAGLTTKVNGKPLGELLLEDKSFEAILDFEDTEAMERLGWYL